MTVTASNFWDALEARMAEAKAGHTGLEEPLTWVKAIKAFTLTTLVGVAMIIAGFSLGDIADEAITWVAYYDDDTSKEGDEKTDGTKDDPAGTSA